MTNRIDFNGNPLNIASLRRSRGQQNGDKSVVTEKLEAATHQAAERVTGLVKIAPGTSLLIALAAGLALGFWMKRS